MNETSDHYTYYRTRIREFELNPAESGNKASDVAKAGPLVPSSKPVSFQIKTKDSKRTVMEYQSNVLYKTAKADESEEEGDDTENQDSKVWIGIVVDRAWDCISPTGTSCSKLS